MGTDFVRLGLSAHNVPLAYVSKDASVAIVNGTETETIIVLRSQWGFHEIRVLGGIKEVGEQFIRQTEKVT
jgi:hypothetical protein